MEGERPLVVTEEYERLGGKKLSLVDVLAQSVGFMGPVFSAAFIIPLIIGVNASGRGRRNLRRARGADRRRSACSRSAGSWRSTRRRSTPPGRSTTTSRTGSARRSAPRRDGCTTAARSSSRPGSGVLIGGYVHDNLLPVLEIDLDLPIWLWDTIFALGLFAVLYFGVQISTRVQLTLALISIAVVLIFFITVIADLGGDNDIAKAFDPLAGRRVQRDPVRGPVRRADLRGVRDRGEPRRGDRGAQALDPTGRARRRRDRLGLLPDRRVRRGRGVRVRPRR